MVEPVEVVDIALLVDEFVSGITVDTHILLDSALLVFGQVVVHTVGARQVVFFDDVLP